MTDYSHNGGSLSLHGVDTIKVFENNIPVEESKTVLHAIEIQINEFRITCFPRPNKPFHLEVENKCDVVITGQLKEFKLTTPQKEGEDEWIT